MTGRLRTPLAACLYAAVVALGSCEPLRAAEYSAEAVKAVYLYRFASYVDWPAAAGAGGPFTIGVVGDEEVFEHLGRLLAGRAVQNRPAAVQRVASTEDLDDVQILYFGRDRPAAARSLLAAAAVRPILTVTDAEDGLARGATVNFVQIGRNVRFEISLRAAERSGLRIGAGLLSVAARVEGRPQSLEICRRPGPAVDEASRCMESIAMPQDPPPRPARQAAR